MRPFAFVNWRQVNAYFCTAMWLLVIVLVVLIVAHVAHASPAGAHIAVR